MNLYQVQDSDRPLWVVAASYAEALAKWRAVIAKENDERPEEVFDPQGIVFVCESDELIL